MRQRTSALIALLMATSVATSQIAEIGKPLGEFESLDETYIDQGACPFECCNYGDWTVLEETVLYDAVDSARAITTLAECDKVRGVTGEVHVRPVRAQVWKAHIDDLGNRFNKGDEVYLLTSRGEGFFLAWSDGLLFEMDGTGVMTREDCAHFQDRCWALLSASLDHTWWIRIETSSGLQGWTKESRHFDGQDHCAVPRASCPPK